MWCLSCRRSISFGMIVCPICGGASATEELPVTEAVRAVVVGYTRRWQNWLLAPIGAGVLGICYLAGSGSQADCRGIGGVFVLGAVLTLLVWLVSPLARRFERDLHSSTFLRTTGEVRYSCPGVVGCDLTAGESYKLYTGIVHEVRVAGHRLMWSPPSWEEISRLERLSWGTVDHLKHSEVVLEIRDESGEVVYRHPSYWPLRDTSLADSGQTASAA